MLLVSTPYGLCGLGKDTLNLFPCLENEGNTPPALRFCETVVSDIQELTGGGNGHLFPYLKESEGLLVQILVSVRTLLPSLSRS